ncbi:MAG TPA: LuxR C-terminal-related transcriptional regulator [Chloroflexia bacterium]|nr:LuxR C-terminal-related transcriptional regulator [Chloroflexia bacterium]
MLREASPILCTKLYFPQVRSQLVLRPRLVAQLEQGLTRRLTLISASAGYGKTTLLSEWRMSRPDEPVAWLSLDSGDNDPARFLAYVTAALKTVLPDFTPVNQEDFFSPQPQDIKLALTNLINSITTGLARQQLRSLILVLEDYHVIESESVHTAVSFLLNHMPPEMHLIITTRIDPALPMHRLLAQDQVIKLGTSDLRFNQPEVASFMALVGGSELKTEDLSQLAERTEGWAVGLQLAALSLKDRRDIKGFFKAFSGNNRFVLGYLAEEVLSLLPDNTRSFLLETSIFERFNARLVEAVCPVRNASQMLVYLQEANLFLFALDETGEWYRYHRLFAEFLNHRLNQEQPDRLLELHRRAGEWFEQEGLAAESIGHYLAARAYESAAHLIEKVAWSMIMRGELTTLDGWLKQLPPAIFRASPSLCLYYAWKLYLRRHFGHHEEYLQIAEDAWRLQNNLVGLGEVFYLRSYFAHTQGNYRAAIDYAEQALALLPESDLANRGNANNALGWACLMNGEAARSQKAFSEGRAQCHRSGNLLGEQSCSYGLGDALEMQGRFREAKPLYEEALALLPDKPEFLAMIEIRLGQLYMEWNQLEKSSRYLAHLESLDEQGVDLTSLPGGYMFMAEMWWLRGDYSRAFEKLKKAQELARRANFSFQVDQIAAYEGWLWLNLGDTLQMNQWREEYFPNLEALVQKPPTYQEEAKYLTLCAILLIQKQVDKALQLLHLLEEVATRQGRTINLLQILTLTAITQQAAGNTVKALATLDKVLAASEPEGYRRLFLNRGAPMRELLQIALTRLPRYSTYIRSLLNDVYPDQILQKEKEVVPTSTAALQELPGELLTERELEVLRLLNSGASNQKIAETLVVAVSTVKKHLTRIFDKLEVTSRTEALARARKLGLL